MTSKVKLISSESQDCCKIAEPIMLRGEAMDFAIAVQRVAPFGGESDKRVQRMKADTRSLLVAELRVS